MPYAEPFVYLRVNGVFGASGTSFSETWTTGFKFRHPEAAPTPAQLVAFLETASVPLTAFHSGNISAGTNTFMTELTAAFIGTDGKYVGGGAQQTTRRPFTTPVAGTAAGTHAWSQALVLSLRTSITRGPGSNGRVYWPACGLPITATTGLITNAVTDVVVADAKTLIENLNAAKLSAMPGTGKMAVMSQVGPGVAATVTGVRVGRKPDRQERREKKLAEGYSTATVTLAVGDVPDLSDVPIGS